MEGKVGEGKMLSHLSNVYDHIRVLSCDISSRPMGSAADKRASDYIHTFFRDQGLDAWKQEFEVESVSLGNHKVEVIEPLLGEIPSYPILASPSTPEAGLSGELVFVEGLQEPQLGPNIEDKIVLWSCSQRSSFKWPSLRSYHPRAVLAIWPSRGIKPKHYFNYAGLGVSDPVPSFWITWEDGLRLLKAGAKRVRLYLCSKRYKSTSCNIIAELKGTRYPDEIVVIGGHYDSVPDVPGATDNASGIGMVMELARMYAQHGSKRTLRFVAFGGEEGGLLGSKYYVKEMKKQGEGKESKNQLGKHLFYMNLDTLGTALGNNSCYVLGSPEITAAVETLSKELGIPHEVKEEIDGSDHLPFAWEGIPNVSLVREGPGLEYIHTVEDTDTIDLIDIDQLQRIGKFIDTFLTRTTAKAEVWPFEQQIPENLVKEIGKAARQRGWPEEEGTL